MRVVIEVSEVVKADAGRVFELLTDLESHMRWVSGLTYLSARGKIRPGMRYESVNVAMGNSMAGRHEVRQVIERQLVEIESVTGPLASTIQYSVNAINGLTQVQCTFWVTSDHPVFGLATPVLEMLARSRLESDIKNLKHFAEAGMSGFGVSVT
jgi:uncharacterized protein YndB with AHSA1/START domain